MPLRNGSRSRATFASLKSSRNYRLFFAGQLVSVVGTWLHQVAETWLVYSITDSGFAVGAVMAARFAPILTLGLWGGSLADRYDRRRLLIITQALRGTCAGILGIMALTGNARPLVVYVLALLAGVSNAIDNPVRRAFVGQLVEEQYLLNAVSLTSSVMAISRVLGPLLAGAMIASVGVGWCFVINAISYSGVIAALAAMDSARFRPVARTRRAGSIRDGLRYARRERAVFAPLVMVAVVSAAAWNWETLLVVHAKQSFNGGERLFTVLFATMSVGTLLGALINAGRSSVSAAQLPAMAATLGTAMIGVAAVPGIPLSMAMLVASGVGAAVFNTASNAVVQLAAKGEYHGRTMALFSVLFVGTKGIGGAAAGAVTQGFGVRWGIAASAAACLAVAAWARAYGLAPSARPDHRVDRSVSIPS